MRILSFFMLFAGLALIVSCKKSEDCNTDGVTYTNTVKEIFDANCSSAGCHESGSINGSGSLADYNDALTFVAQGRILGALRHEDGFVAMPPTGSQLDDCEIQQIEAWISDGAPQ